MNRRLALHRAVALQADSLYEDSKRFGTRSAMELSGQRGPSQIRGLEAIAGTAMAWSEVLDFIKRQTARLEEWRKGNLGKDLLSYLTEELFKRRDAMAAELQATDEEKQQLTLLLFREFIRQLAAQDAFARPPRGDREART